MAVGGDSFIRVTSALLQAGAEIGASEIAQSAGVPEPTTHRILRFYRYHRAVRQTRGALRPDKRKVFQLAAGVRRAQAVPDLVLRYGGEQSTLVARLKEEGISFVLGSTSAANLLAYFEPASEITMYLESSDRLRAKQVIQERKGNTRIHIRYTILDHIDSIERDGVLVTAPYRTLLDVAADSTGGAHAEFLYQTLVEGERP